MTLAQVWEVAGPEHFVAGHVQQPIKCIVCKAIDTRPMLAAIDPSDQVVLGYYHKHHRVSTLVRAGIWPCKGVSADFNSIAEAVQVFRAQGKTPITIDQAIRVVALWLGSDSEPAPAIVWNCWNLVGATAASKAKQASQ